MPWNSLPDADFNLPEMKTKSPSCPSGRVHMYAQMKSQRDSSFPADGHKASLNKMNNKSKTNRKQTNIDN